MKNMKEATYIFEIKIKIEKSKIKVAWIVVIWFISIHVYRQATKTIF